MFATAIFLLSMYVINGLLVGDRDSKYYLSNNNCLSSIYVDWF